MTSVQQAEGSNVDIQSGELNQQGDSFTSSFTSQLGPDGVCVEGRLGSSVLFSDNHPDIIQPKCLQSGGQTVGVLPHRKNWIQVLLVVQIL